MTNYFNLEHRAFIEARADLTHGIRAGIKSLCNNLYSEGLLVSDLHLRLSSLDTISEDALSKKVLNVLQDRMKVDPSAFHKIVKVLQETTGLSYLGDKLMLKLSMQREVHAVALQIQAEANIQYAGI